MVVHVISVALSTHKASCQLLFSEVPVAAHQKLNLCCSKSHDNLCSTQLNAVPCVVGVSLSKPLTNLAPTCVCMYARTCICSINIYWSFCKQQKWKVYSVTEIQVTVKADTLWILKWCRFAHIMVLYNYAHKFSKAYMPQTCKVGQ